MNFDHSLDTNLTPTESWIAKTDSLKNSLNIDLKAFATFSFCQWNFLVCTFFDTESEKLLFHIFISCSKPSDIALAWFSGVVNWVIISDQIASKVPWGESVYSFIKIYHI